MYADDDSLGACAARERCLKMGADLPSPRSLEDLGKLIDFVLLKAAGTITEFPFA